MTETAEPAPLCLRCKTVPLDVLESDDEIAFFACSRCRRQYTRAAGAGLTFRWGNPLSLALYGVIYAETAPPHAERLADQLADGKDPAVLERYAQEIELELDDPTQAITEILPMAVPKTEEDLREFLRLFADRLRQRAVR